MRAVHWYRTVFLLLLALCIAGQGGFEQDLNPIGNRIVEEDEIQRIQLSEHYKGNLLSYKLSIWNKTGFVRHEIQDMIKLQNPLKTLANSFISNTSFGNIRQNSWPQSSVTVEMKNTLRVYQLLAFITRDMRFLGYNMTAMMDSGKIQKVYDRQLNKTYINADCRDLMAFFQARPQDQQFLFFCKYQRAKDGNLAVLETYLAIICINKYQLDLDPDHPQAVIEYVVPDYFSLRKLRLIFESGFEKIQSTIDVNKESRMKDQVFLAARQNNPDVTRAPLQLIRVNMTVFKELTTKGIPYMLTDEPVIFQHQDFHVINSNEREFMINNIIMLKNDFNQPYAYFAVNFVGSSSSVVICKVESQLIGSFTEANIYCDYQKNQVLPILKYEINRLYQAPLETFDVKDQRQHFFGICTQPLAIAEFSYEDNIENVLITKIYSIQLITEKYYGHASMAANKDYVVHLLENPETGHQVIRVYCRNSALHSMARFEIAIPNNARAGYFIFPNTFFNYLIFRDERTINVTSIVEWSLVLNATNSTLVNIYKNQQIQTKIIVENRDFITTNEIKISFVDKYNTSIVALNSVNAPTEIRVLYNCGEDNVNYIVKDYLTGPNFNLSRIDKQESKYFTLENQGLSEYFRTDQILVGKNCKINFWFVYEGYYTINSKQLSRDEYFPTILVCIDQETSTITSYILRDQDDMAEKTNEIVMPALKFVDFTYDVSQRLIIALAEQPGYENRRNPNITNNRYEIHLFKVQNEVIWVKLIPFTQGVNVTIMSYNQNLKSIMFVEYREIVSKRNESSLEVEILRIYPFNIQITALDTRFMVGTTLDKPWGNRTVRAYQASEHAVFTMTAASSITVREIAGTRISLVRELVVPDLISFDIFDDKYFVVYSGQNTVLVYEIEVYLDLRYRMTIPLYRDYENFRFRLAVPQSDIRQVARTYNRDFMGFLATNQTHTMIFVYALQVKQQHNSMVFAQDLTEQFGADSSPDDTIRLFLSGDVETLTTLVTVSHTQVRLYEAIYYNRLNLNQSALPQLVDKCRKMLMPDDFPQNQADKWVQDVENFTVQAKSLFPSAQDNEENSEIFSVRIQSANQGGAVVARSAKDEKVKIMIQGDTSKTQEPYRLLYETYIQGQNLKSRTQCRFMLPNGTNASCDEALTEEVKDVPYSFPIEFVTSVRKISRSFTLAQLFFMLDDAGSLIIQRLPLYSKVLDSVNTQALITLAILSQDEVFGCQLTGFISSFDVTDHLNKTAVPDGRIPLQKYLMMYQCIESNYTQRIALNYILFTVFPIPDKQEQYQINQTDPLPFIYYRYKDKLPIPYEIIDIAMMNWEYDRAGYLSFAACITELIPMAYSNVFTVYRIEFVSDFTRLNAQQIELYTATMLDKDTFYATKMLAVPNTGLLVLTLRNTGAMLLNITALEKDGIDGMRPPLYKVVLRELRFADNLTFANQLYIEKGPLIVYTAMANWPNSLHFLTNYGMMVYDFQTSLTSTRPDEVISVKPKAVRLIRIEFDQFNGEVAQNPYGSAFLIKKYDVAKNFQVKLAAMSYYSAPNSQFFKLINITWNENCFALNQNSYFEMTPEDQIAVSFICNDQFKIYRVCMRPHVVVDFTKISQNATMKVDGRNPDNDAFSFNQFYLDIQSWQSNFNNSYKISVQVGFEAPVDKTTSVTIGAALTGVILLCAFVFAGAQSCCSSTLLDQEDEKQKPQRALSQYSEGPSIFGTQTTMQNTGDISPFMTYRRINASTIVDESFAEQPKLIQAKIQDDSFVSEGGHSVSMDRDMNLMHGRDWLPRPTSRFGAQPQ